MNSNRDDFSEKVKRRIGYCAGFRCCCPGCNKLLIGKALNPRGYVFNGVYAHITAASTGGPRYDASLTSEERKSYDNGILLCQDHASLIDKDELNYPVNLLKEWKNQSEELVRKELTTGRYYEKTSNEIEAMFSSLFDNGEFFELARLIKEYGSSFGEEKDEILLRYSIYLHLANGEDLSNDIDRYIKNKYASTSWLICELILFDERELIKSVETFIVDKELKRLASVFLSNPIGQLTSNKEFIDLFKLEGGTVSNFVLQSLYYSEYGCVAVNKDNEDIKFKDDTFLYEMMRHTISLKRKIMSQDVDDNSIEEASFWLTKNISVIKGLSQKLRLPCFVVFLRYLLLFDSNRYAHVYNSLIKEDKAAHQIIITQYEYKLRNDFNSIDADKLFRFCKTNGDFKLFCMWLFSLDVEPAKKYIEDHLYCLKESPLILTKYIMLFDESVRKDIVLKYKEYFDDMDFTMSCLLWRYDIDPEKHRDNCLPLEREPFKGLNVFNVMLYLDTLIKKDLYDRYFELAEYITQADLDVTLSAFTLQSKLGDNKAYDDKLISVYENLIKNGFEFNSLHYNLSMLYHRNNRNDLAIEQLLIEYKNYHSVSSIHSLVAIRMDQKEWVKDFIFEDAKSFDDYNCQMYVAEVLYQYGEYLECLKYYERGIICAQDNSCGPGKLYEIVNILKLKTPKQVEESTAVTIKNSERTLTLLFHTQETMNVFRQQFEYDGHLDENRFSDFSFKHKGDIVRFKGEKYTIIEIENLYLYYSRFVFQRLIKDPSTVIFSGESVEEAIENITQALKRQQAIAKKSINNYNETKGLVPISISYSRFFGGDLFKNLGYLYSEKYLHYLMTDAGLFGNSCDKVFFYYDSLFALYLLYRKEKYVIKDNWYIPKRICNNLLAECNKMLREIKYDGERLTVIDDKAVRIKQDSGSKNMGRNWYTGFKNFLSSFKTIDGGLCNFEQLFDIYHDYSEEIKDERELLDLIQRNETAYLVTDLPFMQVLVRLMNRNSCGSRVFVASSLEEGLIKSYDTILNIK